MSRLRLAVAALALLALPGAAQPPVPYPSRPIHLIVPTAPGGAGDTLARRFGDELAVALKVPVVVDNKPGGSGIVGNEAATRAPGDGYTLLFATSATLVISAYTMRKLPYDPLKDFTPVINIGYATSVLVVNAKLPVQSVAELIEYAKARPGKLYYASSGVGSANHIDTEVFDALAGIELVHVPYRGTADGYRALLANDVQVMFGAITSALPLVKAGKVRALAVLVDKRSPLLPDVPTIAQAGLGSVDVRKWLGFVAPAGTPPEIVDRLNRALDEILHRPSVRAWLDSEGMELAGGSAQDFDTLIRADYAKWGDTIRRFHVQSE